MERKITRREFGREALLTTLGLANAIFLPSCESFAKPLPTWMPPVANKYYPTIVRESKKRGIDPRLFACVVNCESGWYTKALSSDDAKGLSQIIPQTEIKIAQRMGDQLPKGYDIYHPPTNLAMGISHLSFLIGYYGDTWIGVCRYYGDKTLEKSAYGQSIKALYDCRNNPTCEAFEKWLRSVNNSQSFCGGNGALLRCAFMEQSLDYENWINERNQKDHEDEKVEIVEKVEEENEITCKVVNGENLPGIIHPGDTFDFNPNDQIPPYVVQPGDYASDYYYRDPNSPDSMTWCSKWK